MPSRRAGRGSFTAASIARGRDRRRRPRCAGQADVEALPVGPPGGRGITATDCYPVLHSARVIATAAAAGEPQALARPTLAPDCRRRDGIGRVRGVSGRVVRGGFAVERPAAPKCTHDVGGISPFRPHASPARHPLTRFGPRRPGPAALAAGRRGGPIARAATEGGDVRPVPHGASAARATSCRPSAPTPARSPATRPAPARHCTGSTSWPVAWPGRRPPPASAAWPGGR